MSQLLEPRRVEVDAWKRWCKTGFRLTLRLWMSALPLSLIVGVGVGWTMEHVHPLLGLVAVTFSGLWHAMLFTLAERAAEGKRVSVGDAWAGLAEFVGLNGRAAWDQLRHRAIRTFVLAAALLTIFGLVMLIFASSAPAEPVAPRVRPDWFEWASLCSSWTLVFLWGAGLQGGGVMSSASMLMRKHGLGFEEAETLWSRAVLKNAPCISFVGMLFLVVSQIMLVLPFLSFFIFPLEVFWACVVTVAGRDIFGHKEALEKQEARESASAAVPSLT